MSDIDLIMQQAKEMEKKMQESLANKIFEGKSGGGLVTVKVDWEKTLKQVKIDPSLMNPQEKEILEDLIVAAFGDAMKNAGRAGRETLTKIFGSLAPGFKPPFV